MGNIPGHWALLKADTSKKYLGISKNVFWPSTL